jgi:PAB1-binding protein PBP1
MEAESLERELTTKMTDSTNRHVMEERGLLDLKETDETGNYDNKDQNEEMLYSGVVRKIGTGKFTCWNQTVKSDAFTTMQTAFIKKVANSNQSAILSKVSPPINKVVPASTSTNNYRVP